MNTHRLTRYGCIAVTMLSLHVLISGDGFASYTPFPTDTPTITPTPTPAIVLTARHCPNDFNCDINENWVYPHRWEFTVDILDPAYGPSENVVIEFGDGGSVTREWTSGNPAVARHTYEKATCPDTVTARAYIVAQPAVAAEKEIAVKGWFWEGAGPQIPYPDPGPGLPPYTFWSGGIASGGSGNIFYMPFYEGDTAVPGNAYWQLTGSNCGKDPSTTDFSCSLIYDAEWNENPPPEYICEYMTKADLSPQGDWCWMHTTQLVPGGAHSHHTKLGGVVAPGSSYSTPGYVATASWYWFGPAVARKPGPEGDLCGVFTVLAENAIYPSPCCPEATGYELRSWVPLPMPGGGLITTVCPPSDGCPPHVYELIYAGLPEDPKPVVLGWDDPGDDGLCYAFVRTYEGDASWEDLCILWREYNGDVATFCGDIAPVAYLSGIPIVLVYTEPTEGVWGDELYVGILAPFSGATPPFMVAPQNLTDLFGMRVVGTPEVATTGTYPDVITVVFTAYGSKAVWAVQAELLYTVTGPELQWHPPQRITGANKALHPALTFWGKVGCEWGTDNWRFLLATKDWEEPGIRLNAAIRDMVGIE